MNQNEIEKDVNYTITIDEIKEIVKQLGRIPVNHCKQTIAKAKIYQIIGIIVTRT